MRSLTFTIDPGTASERSYRFAASDILEVHNQREVFPISAPDIPIALFLAKLPPLPPGAHRVAFSIEMSSRRCDGLGTASENCRNAGTRRLGSCPFVPIHGCAAAVAGVAALAPTSHGDRVATPSAPGQPGCAGPFLSPAGRLASG